MKKYIYILFCSALLSAFCACGNKSNDGNGVNPEADSLQHILDTQKATIQDMTLFIEAVNTSMDSINSMDGKIIKTSKESKKSVTEQIKDNLRAYKATLQRQHKRIAELEQRARKSGSKVSPQMLQTIASLKKQLAEKDSTIARLNRDLEQRNFDIKALQENVEKLNGSVKDLTDKNKEQEETIKAQIDQLNEGYYIIATKKQLKAAGIMSGSSLFRRSRLSMSDACAPFFKKIDIRNVKTLNIPGNWPQMLTQAPPSSYSITKNGDGTCTLTIKDAQKFWSYSNFLVIRY